MNCRQTWLAKMIISPGNDTDSFYQIIGHLIIDKKSHLCLKTNEKEASSWPPFEENSHTQTILNERTWKWEEPGASSCCRTWFPARMPEPDARALHGRDSWWTVRLRCTSGNSQPPQERLFCGRNRLWSFPLRWPEVPDGENTDVKDNTPPVETLEFSMPRIFERHKTPPIPLLVNYPSQQKHVNSVLISTSGSLRHRRPWEDDNNSRIPANRGVHAGLDDPSEPPPRPRWAFDTIHISDTCGAPFVCSCGQLTKMSVVAMPMHHHGSRERHPRLCRTKWRVTLTTKISHFRLLVRNT